MEARQSGGMTLMDVKEPADFNKLYQDAGLPDDDQAKVAFLMDNLKIRKTRSERPESPKERLVSLEEFALLFPEYRKEQP